MPNVSPHGIYVRSGGVWKPAADVDVKRSGAWAQAKSVHANRSGTWTKVWEDNAAPNPVTGLTVATAWNGTNYTATATWTNPGDADLSLAEVTWNVNGTPQAPATQSAATTTATRAVDPNATVAATVRLKDTGNLYSTYVTSATVTAGPGALSGVTVTAMSLDVVSLAYTSPAGAASISVSRSVNGGTASTVTLATTGPWEDTIGTAASVSYTLRAYTAAGGFGPPTTVTGTTTLGTLSSITMAGDYATNWSTASFTWSRTGTGSTTTLPGSVYYRSWIGTTSGPVTTTTSSSISLAGLTDTTFTLYVRMESYYAGRFVTGPSTPTRTLTIGHAAYTSTDPYSGTATVNLYANSAGTGSLTGAGGVVVPSNATVTSMTVNLATTFATSIFCNYNNRDAYVVKGGVVNSTKIGQKPEPWSETFTLSPSAGPGFAGILLVGTGWSWTSTGGFRATGTITVTGTQVVNNPAVNNTVA